LKSNLDKEEKFNIKCQNLIREGYSFYFKINTIIDLLHMDDTSQTRKYKYEQCMGFLITSSTYLNIINDMVTSKYNLDLEKYEHLMGGQQYALTIHGEEYLKLIDRKKKLLIDERINVMHNYLNQFILQIKKVNIIINLIDI
jgi:hypothetical protein